MKRVACVGAIAVLLLGGCRSWEAIRPEQLPQLNGAFSQTVGYDTDVVPTGRGDYATTTSPVTAYSVQQVERSDGTLLEVSGDFHVRLTYRSGVEVFFEHPVQSELEGSDVLVIRAGNMPATPTRLDNIALLEVGQRNVGATVGAVFGLVLALGVGIGLLVFVATAEFD